MLRRIDPAASLSPDRGAVVRAQVFVLLRFSLLSWACIYFALIAVTGHTWFRSLAFGFAAVFALWLILGALFSDGAGVTRSRPVTDLYATVGARVGLTLTVSDRVGFALDAEAPLALSRVHLLVDDAGVSRELWAAGRVGFIAGARVVLKLH